MWIATGESKGNVALFTNGGSDAVAVGSATAAKHNLIEFEGASFTFKPTDYTTTREGYAFDGWYKNAAFTEDSKVGEKGVECTVGATTRLYAKWVANEAKIVLDAKGGTVEAANGGIVADGKLTIAGDVDSEIASTSMPEATRADYVLCGWYKQDGTGSNDESAWGDKVESLPSKMPASGATYYAKWAQADASIKFVTNGGSAVAEITGAAGNAIESWPAADADNAPVREGYTLEGWYVDSRLTSKVDVAPAKLVAGTTTYYAKWTPNEVTISFVDGDASASARTLTGNVGEAIANRNMPAISKTGYTFAGWYESAEAALAGGQAVGELPATYPTANASYYARWTANPATLVFATSDGELKVEGDLASNATLSEDGKKLTITSTTGASMDEVKAPEAKRDGYEFAGWTVTNTAGANVDDLGGGANEAEVALPSEFLAGTTTYTATWTAAPAYIQLDTGFADGTLGSYSGKFESVTDEGDQPTGVFQLEGETDGSIVNVNGGVANLPEKLAKTGYTFDGWYDANGAEVDEDGFVNWNYDNISAWGTQQTILPKTFAAGTTTYYAKWTPNSVTVTFEVNVPEGTSVSESPVPYTGRVGERTNMNAWPTLSLKDGAKFRFDGWYENAECTGDKVGGTDCDALSAFPTTNKVYYAKWVRTDTITYTFELDGGTGVENVSGPWGEAVPEDQRTIGTPTKAGYTFGGWYRSVDFADDGKIEPNGEGAYMLPETFNDDEGTISTYYAKWNPLTVYVEFITGEHGGLSLDGRDDITGKDGYYSMKGATGATIEDAARTIVAAPNDGYSLEGWYTSADFTEDTKVELIEGNLQLSAAFEWNADNVTTGENGQPASSATTYYAKFTADASTIEWSVNYDGGENAGFTWTGVTDETLPLEDGEGDDARDYTALPAPERTGYKFIGWFEGNGSSAGDAEEGEPSEGESDKADDADDAAKWGKQIVLAGEGVTAGEGQTLLSAFPANGVTYYAKWEALPVYIAFDMDGGVKADGTDEPIATIEGHTGEDIADRIIPAVSKDGYDFKGWFTNSNKIEGAVSPNGEGNYLLPERFTWDASKVTTGEDGKPASCTITYYAKWEGQDSNVFLDPNGGTFKDASTLTIEDGKAKYSGVTGGTLGGTAPAVSKDGYEFKGWFKVDAQGSFTSESLDTTTNALPATYPAGDVTYKAKWGGQESVIKFVLMLDGKECQTVTEATGTTGDPYSAGLPAVDLEGQGYTFGGWYDTVAFETEVTADTVTKEYPANGITYYGKLEKMRQVIRFDTGWDQWTEDDWQGFTGDATGKTLPAPTATREGFTFGGWVGADKNPVTEMSAFPAGTVESDADKYGVTVLTASWSEAGVGRYVFVSNGGSEVDEWKGNGGDAVEHDEWPTTTREGYEFTGWYTDSTCETPAGEKPPATYERDTTINYYAGWNPLTIYVKFAAGKGAVATDESSLPLDDITTYTGDEKYLNVPMPTMKKVGYTFAGWFDSADFTGDERKSMPAKMEWSADTATGEGSQASCDITYYAKWTPNTFTYNFNTNGGTSVNPISGTVDTAVAYRSMPITTKSGYTFSGWYADADFSGEAVTQLDATYPAVEGDSITYYAKWEAEDAYIVLDYAWTDREGGQTVSYKGSTDSDSAEAVAGEGAFNEGTPGLVVDSNGKSVTWIGKTDAALSTADELIGVESAALPTPTRADHEFIGWFTADGDAEGADAENPWGDAVTLDTTFPAGEDTVYYAKWRNTNVYTITFDPHLDGAEAMAFTVDHGSTFAASNPDATEPTFERKGYTLAGWFTQQGGMNGNEPDENWGDKLDWDTFADESITASATYHAQWIALGSTVEWNVNGGDAMMPDNWTGYTDEPFKNDSRTELPVPTRTGYDFAGWFTAVDDSGNATGDEVTIEGSFPWNDEGITGEGAAATSTTTYYAKWKAAESEVAFHGNGGAISEYGAGEGVSVTLAEDGSLLTLAGETGSAIGGNGLPEASRTGYDFAGWWTKNGDAGDVVDGDNAEDAENGEPAGDAGADVDAAWGTKLGEMLTEFPAGGADYYARWTPAASHLIFTSDLEGVTIGGQTGSVTWTGETDQKLTDADPSYTDFPEVAMPGGYDFLGWWDLTNKKQVSKLPETFPAGDITYAVLYRVAGQATITFETNCEDVSVEPESGTPGMNIPGGYTMPDLAGKKDGYTFTGWWTQQGYSADEDGSNPKWDGDWGYQQSVIYTFPGDNVTYYAKWVPNTYSIVFDMNDADNDIKVSDEFVNAWNALSATDGIGVTYESADGLPDLNVVDEGAAMDAPKREGYKFSGWTVSVEGEDGETEDVAWYSATIGEDGTTWATELEGAWNDLKLLDGEGDQAKIVLHAKWIVVINVKVPASITFNIDATKNPAEAAAQSGALESRTPAAIKLSQVNSETGLGSAEVVNDNSTDNQLSMDVKLNMTAGNSESTGSSVNLDLANNEQVELTEEQLANFVISAWSGDDDSKKLSVAYKLVLGENVTVDKLLSANKIATVYYAFGLMD